MSSTARCSNGPIVEYTPTPDDIRRACERIQRTWSPMERLDRRVGLDVNRYVAYGGKTDLSEPPRG